MAGQQVTGGRRAAFLGLGRPGGGAAAATPSPGFLLGRAFRFFLLLLLIILGARPALRFSILLFLLPAGRVGRGRRVIIIIIIVTILLALIVTATSPTSAPASPPPKRTAPPSSPGARARRTRPRARWQPGWEDCDG
jgi:hypothetical protein